MAEATRLGGYHTTRCALCFFVIHNGLSGGGGWEEESAAQIWKCTVEIRLDKFRRQDGARQR